MSDHMTRGFRAQLTATMDSVLRRAVFEIMNIFENSLHTHQMELAQKGEEVAQLKIKLQTAELKLKDHACERERERDRGAEKNKTPTQTQKEPQAVKAASGQPSEVPEIDFEVPDDWCAPLGCETVTKPDEGACPSVRLRPLTIPLWHIPILKHEVVNCDIDFHRKTKGRRRSRRISTLNESHKPTQDGKLSLCDLETRSPPLRNDMKKLLQDIKQEYCELTQFEGFRRRGRKPKGKAKETTDKSKKEERKSTATESKSVEQETAEKDGKNMYTCKICKKVFDTKFGHSVHARSHKRCRGCKKVFPFPSVLRCHKLSCKRLKKLLKKEAANPPKPSCDEEETPAPSKKRTVVKESTPSSGTRSALSTQADEATKKHSCPHCNKEYSFRYMLTQHMRVHTGERPFSCHLCPKTFRIKSTLKTHMMRVHKGQMTSNDTIGDLAWTKPLEEIEDNREDLRSPGKDRSQAINHNKKRKRSADVSVKWQTMGVRYQNGFLCLVCQKMVKSKRLLIEHVRIHTGERPISCENCPAKFRTKAQLYMHRKKCPSVAATYNKHASKHQKK